jgi:hypothetical protein
MEKGLASVFVYFQKSNFLKRETFTKTLTNPCVMDILKSYFYGMLKRRVSKSRAFGGRARTLGRLNDFLEQAKDFKR